jgi:tetratricopeptide (TPR) repeat protein
MIRARQKILVAAIAVAVPVVGGNLSARADDRTLCEDRNSPADPRIAACTRRISSGLKGRALAIAYANRAGAYRFKALPDLALPDYDKTIRLGLKSAAVYVNRGGAHNEKGDYDPAIADFNEAIRLNARDADAYIGRAVAWKGKREFDRALADYALAIRLDPNSVLGHYGRGNLLTLRGDYRAALADFDRALQLDPTYFTAHLSRGVARYNLGNNDDAIEDFNKTIQADPGYTIAYSNRGRAYEAKGQHDLARRDYEKALAVPPKYFNGELAHRTARARLAALNEKAGPVASVASPASAATSDPLVADRRIALVIGNARYAGAPILKNPLQDAETVAAALRGIGFQTVRIASDVSKEQLVAELRGFAREAERADWAIVYYAGHGIEMNGTNYLLPVDVKLETDRDVGYEAVALDQVLNAVEGAKRLRLVVLDACRDNPFTRQMRRTGLTRSIGRGLAAIEPDAGTMVIYSAKHGETALDGDGANSPFTVAFVKNLSTPGLEVRRMFDLVRDDVMEATARRQQPFVYGSVPGRQEFYFAVKQ